MDEYSELFKNIDTVQLDEEVEKFIKTWPTNETVKSYLTTCAKLYDYMLLSPLVKDKAAKEENLGQFNHYLEFFGAYSEETRATSPGDLARFIQSCNCLFDAHRFAWIKFLQRAKLRFLVLFTLNNVLMGKFFHIASYAEIQDSGPGIFFKKVASIPQVEAPKKPEKEKYRAKIKKPKNIDRTKRGKQTREKPRANEKNSGPASPDIPVLSHKVSNWYDE